MTVESDTGPAARGGDDLPSAYKRAWDTYVDFSIDSGKTTFDCIKAVVDAVLAQPVAWRSREKGSATWQVHAGDPTDAISKYAVAGLGGYDIEPLYALAPAAQAGGVERGTLRSVIVGKVTGTEYEGDQVPGMPGAICHACGLKDYPCVNPDCPNRSALSHSPQPAKEREA